MSLRNKFTSFVQVIQIGDFKESPNSVKHIFTVESKIKNDAEHFRFVHCSGQSATNYFVFKNCKLQFKTLSEWNTYLSEFSGLQRAEELLKSDSELIMFQSGIDVDGKRHYTCLSIYPKLNVIRKPYDEMMEILENQPKWKELEKKNENKKTIFELRNRRNGRGIMVKIF